MKNLLLLFVLFISISSFGESAYKDWPSSLKDRDALLAEVAKTSCDKDKIMGTYSYLFPKSWADLQRDIPIELDRLCEQLSGKCVTDLAKKFAPTIKLCKDDCDTGLVLTPVFCEGDCDEDEVELKNRLNKASLTCALESLKKHSIL